jgi:hypothetical protein
MECETKSDAETLAASVSAEISKSKWAVDLSVSITKAKESSKIRSNITYNHHPIGWIAPTLPNTAEILDSNIKAFDGLTSEQLSDPVAYICYDWREIPAIQACAWGRNPDINMLAVQQNLPFVTDAYQELSYAGALSETALDNMQYRGEPDRQTLIRLKGTMNQRCLELLSFSVKDVATLDVGQFSQTYDGDMALYQITQIMQGWQYHVQVWTLKQTTSPRGQFYGKIWLEVFNKAGEQQGKRVELWSHPSEPRALTLRKNTRNFVNADKYFFFEELAKVKETAFIQLRGELRERGGASERNPCKGNATIKLKDLLEVTQKGQRMNVKFTLEGSHKIEVDCFISGDVIQ